MKTLIVNLLICFLVLSACDDDKAPAPVIKLQSLVISGDTTINYKDSLDKLPVLYAGDVVEVKMNLEGNGFALNSLNVSSNREGLKAFFLPSNPDYISDDKNFTDLDGGRLSFVDGVTKATWTAKAIVFWAEDGKAKLSFHLSARTDCESGGTLVLEFKTGDISALKNSKNKR